MSAALTNPRFMHMMIRVADPEASIKFYSQVLGMRVLRVDQNPKWGFDLIFMGYGPELAQQGDNASSIISNTVIEMTYNYDKDKSTGFKYEGTSGGFYGHIALGCDDVPAAVKRCRELGVEVSYDDSTDDDVQEKGFMAFIKGPNGEEIELLNTKRMLDVCQKDYAKPNVTVWTKPVLPEKKEEEKKE